MRKIYVLLLTILATSIVTFSHPEAATTRGKKGLLHEERSRTSADFELLYNLKEPVISKLEIPRIKPQEYIITHAAYSLSYNEANEQANWVAYELTSEETKPTFKRANKFSVDSEVKTGSANDQDYKGSGYDRGHLAPAGDMGWSATAMKESFYYSNMSPQTPGFNRGVWKRAEELVRIWAKEYKSVYIVTGPVLTAGLQTIGYDKVSVPKYYYKVILDDHAPGVKGIGFIIANTGSQESLQSFAVSIDRVEKMIGIDFFPLLPDKQEKNIESNLDVNAWIWKSSKSNGEKVYSSLSVQCKGITKKGKRCKNRTRNANGRCYLHPTRKPSAPPQRSTALINKIPDK